MIPFLQYMSQDQSESKINPRENFQLSEFSAFNSEKKKDRTRNRLIGTTIRRGKKERVIDGFTILLVEKALPPRNRMQKHREIGLRFVPFL